MSRKRVVVLDVVGLSPTHFEDKQNIPILAVLLDPGTLYNMKTVFPAPVVPPTIK